MSKLLIAAVFSFLFAISGSVIAADGAGSTPSRGDQFSLASPGVDQNLISDTIDPADKKTQECVCGNNKTTCKKDQTCDCTDPKKAQCK